MLKDAATLSELCALHWMDEDRLEGEPRELIHYAVDTGLVVMYAQPSRKPERHPAVFSQAPDIHESELALVGDLVMRRLNAATADAFPPGGKLAPLIALPPHDEENKRVVLAIARDAEEFLADVKRRLPTLVARITEAIAGASEAEASQRFLSVLAEDAPALAAWLGGTSPTELLRLLPKGRLVPPKLHPAFGEARDRLRYPTGRLANGRHVELADVADAWFKRMTRNLREMTPDQANKLNDDAWALAYLDWINRDAVERELRQRVVLVTTNQLVVNAAVSFKTHHAGFAHFGEAYVRDARSLLGAKHCFAPTPTEKTEFRIQEFLSVLFPNSIYSATTRFPKAATVDVNASAIRRFLSGWDMDKKLNLLTAAGGATERTSNFPDDDLARWRQVVTGTLAQVVMNRRQQHGETALPGNIGDKVNVELFLEDLIRSVQASFADLYLRMGVIGVEQLLDGDHDVRGLPALRFDPLYPRAQAQAQALSELMFDREKRKAFDLEHMYAELQHEDDSNYHAHVLHAFVFASSGKWLQARVLCRIALAVVEGIHENQKNGRLGREAAYLMAVAERRLAGRVAKLDHAREALTLARERRDPGAGVDERFTAEELAQDVTELQLGFFTADRKEPVEVRRYLTRAENIVSSVEASGETVNCIRYWIIRQAVTNALLASLVAALCGQRFPQELGRIRDLLAKLADLGLAPDPASRHAKHRYPDEVSDFVWLICATHFGDQKISSGARDALQAFATKHQSIAHLSQLEQLRWVKFLNLVGIEVDHHDTMSSKA
ncbi:hypothetical protein ASF45_27835 [Pseudorhodoferax sp. Leaf265]|nr:hypothetical protein ASF45_27835 [Pseudorhodoferax sp. Leaf265]